MADPPSGVITSPPRAKRLDAPAARFILLTLLAAIELPLLAFFYDPTAINQSSTAWEQARVVLREFVPFSLFFIVALGILATPRWRAFYADWTEAARGHAWRAPLAVNLVLFAAMVAYTFWFNGVDASARAPWGLFALWTLGVGAAYLALAAALAPVRYLIGLVQRERLIFGLAFAAAAVVETAAIMSRSSWGFLSEMTFRVSAFFLSLYETEIEVYPDERVIGVGEFYVDIAPACSGYEGVGLVLTFLSLYLFIFRSSLRFPNALWALPIGAIAIWTLNSVRIAALVSLGAHVSEDIAVTGFHSQAGWMMFLIVTIGIMAITHRVSFFRNQESLAIAAAPAEHRAKTATAMLAPLLAMFAAGIIASAFTGETGGYWLYSLRVAAILIAIGLFWRFYTKLDWRMNWEPAALGALVAVGWIATDPGRGEPSELQTWLAGLDPMVAAAFLAMRVFGTAVLVPIAEELGFRGYIHRKLIADRFENVPEGAFSWKALIISSVLFAVLHERWLAGGLAGVVFAIALYRSGKITGAIVAHAVANAIIAAWAIAFAQYSLL